MSHLSITKITFHSFKSLQSILKHKLNPFKKGLSRAQMEKDTFIFIHSFRFFKFTYTNHEFLKPLSTYLLQFTANLK